MCVRIAHIEYHREGKKESLGKMKNAVINILNFAVQTDDVYGVVRPQVMSGDYNKIIEKWGSANE